ncbi:FMR1-interacting protein NUFIP1 [Aulostomus maculatus]
MNEPGLYPPPDFGCPPPNSIQSFQQQQPRPSSFHPGMWTWSETVSEPGWNQSAQAGWHPSSRGSYGPKRPYGQNFGRDWHQQGWRPNHGSNGGNRGKKQRNRKEPEYSHFCDTCDRGFKDQEKYNEHTSQHVKCSVPDCSFMAHEKIVSIHWKNNHAAGAKRIKLDTPEEIAKWREDRRKNYPTLQNVERKKRVMEEREETGAVLETPQFGRMRGRGRGRGRFRGRGPRGFRGRHPRGPHPSDSHPAEGPPPPTQPSRDGDPLGALAIGDHDSDREDPATESRIGGLAVAPKQMSSALGSLVANYGSMSESESEEEPHAAPIQKAKELVQENQALLNSFRLTENRGPSRSTSSQDAGTSRAPQSGSALHAADNRRGGRAGRGGRGGIGRHQDTPQKRRPTLLEMLLAPDIRHERNVLLQCIRYVVRNNFFGLESKPDNQQGIRTTPEKRGTPSEEEGAERESGGGAAEGEAARHKKKHIPDVQEGAEPAGAAVDRRCRDRVGSEPSDEASVDSSVNAAASDEQDVGGLIQTDEETHTAAENHISTFHMYDDEIWESPGAVI